MIYEANIHTRRKLVSMFEDFNNVILLSYLQGHMGRAWVNDLENPTVAQVTVGIFTFYTGDPNVKETEELLRNIPEKMLVIVNSEEWKKRLETFYERKIDKFLRYKFKRNSEFFNRSKLQSFISTLPKGYELRRIDEHIANNSTLHKLSEDFTSQFQSVEDYLNRGIGYSILYNGEVICGASSYSIYDKGIEIEVATDLNHRRKGLATVVSAALILDCLEKGKYPNWDAANTTSAKLAEKLGYVFDKAYDTYFVDNR
ncbi:MULTISPECIES: GNAT family N-acetyltransferase [Bacillus]|uniref:GNAT family N-acetyltransferase n=3 Tax=Bacillus toyonensis TaxID=155322 RepID=A0A2C4UAY8_9BACI|nr:MULTISPECIES: GNAT family N-acetyltransferase [Bacillus]EOP23388.1 zwittermicin A resistance protein ZmaR [Bacillus cereus VD131]OFD00596.1 zwittermicin A resistance protein ZmaR [Bacillus thuringiensis]PKR93082.1 Two-component sensor protein yhcY [Bacillus cereus Rock4-18]KAF6544576.1 GNAT family N-acetyltransferase [Bacillus sp. EKM202B]MBJ7932912.1 GNAT family N-acetyltransferase [Bacillus cereus group sp. N31]